MSFWWHLKREIVSQDRNRRILFYGSVHTERHKVRSLCPDLIFYMVQARVRLQVMEIIIEYHARIWTGKTQIYWNRLYIELLKVCLGTPPPPGKINYPPAKKFWIRAWIVIKCLLSFSHVFIGFFFAVSCIKICYRVRFKQIRTVLILNMFLYLIFVEIGNN